jgi:autotransporter-associated beta strand protein
MGPVYWRWVCAFVVSLGCAIIASAQTWIGGGADSNWSTAANWSGGLIPANDGTADVLMLGPGNLNSIVDVPWSLHSLSFANNAPAFSLSGSDLTIGEIHNPASALQSISNNLFASANLLLDSGGNTFMSGVISGAGGIAKTGGGTLIFGSANTYSGPTVISGGELRADNSSGSATGSGSVTVNPGGILSGSGLVGGGVTVENGGTVSLAAGSGALQLGSLTLKSSKVQFSFDSDVSHHLNIAGSLAVLNSTSVQLVNPPRWEEYGATLIDYSGPALSDAAFARLNLVFQGSCLADFQSLQHDKADTQIWLYLHMSLGQPSWKWSNVSGSWNDPCNWISGRPSGYFPGDSSSSATVTLDGDQTVYDLRISGGNYTIAPPGSLRVTTGRVDVGDGNHFITAPLILPTNSRIEKSGSGSLTISGTQSYAAGTSLAVTGGTVNLNSNSGGGTAATSPLTVNITGSGARVNTGTNQDLKELNVAFGNAGRQTLDLASPAGAGQFRQIQVYSANLVAAKTSLYNALVNANRPCAPDPLDGITDSGLHAGAKIGLALMGDHVTIRPTRVGDLDLDGQVTISDFIDLASNFNTFGNATWQEGDLNYDHNVTISDFIDLASNFNSSYSGETWPISDEDAAALADFAAAHGVAIPEPGSFVGMLITAGALGRRRGGRRWSD